MRILKAILFTLVLADVLVFIISAYNGLYKISLLMGITSCILFFHALTMEY